MDLGKKVEALELANKALMKDKAETKKTIAAMHELLKQQSATLADLQRESTETTRALATIVDTSKQQNRLVEQMSGGRIVQPPALADAPPNPALAEPMQIDNGEHQVDGAQMAKDGDEQRKDDDGNQGGDNSGRDSLDELWGNKEVTNETPKAPLRKGGGTKVLTGQPKTARTGKQQRNAQQQHETPSVAVKQKRKPSTTKGLPQPTPRNQSPPPTPLIQPPPTPLIQPPPPNTSGTGKQQRNAQQQHETPSVAVKQKRKPSTTKGLPQPTPLNQLPPPPLATIEETATDEQRPNVAEYRKSPLKMVNDLFAFPMTVKGYMVNSAEPAGFVRFDKKYGEQEAKLCRSSNGVSANKFVPVPKLCDAAAEFASNTLLHVLRPLLTHAPLFFGALYLKRAEELGDIGTFIGVQADPAKSVAKFAMESFNMTKAPPDTQWAVVESIVAACALYFEELRQGHDPARQDHPPQ